MYLKEARDDVVAAAMSIGPDGENKQAGQKYLAPFIVVYCRASSLKQHHVVI